jgi:hypothetical protein
VLAELPVPITNTGRFKPADRIHRARFPGRSRSQQARSDRTSSRPTTWRESPLPVSQGLVVEPRRLGMSLQTPRELSEADVGLLRVGSGGQSTPLCSTHSIRIFCSITRCSDANRMQQGGVGELRPVGSAIAARRFSRPDLERVVVHFALAFRDIGAPCRFEAGEGKRTRAPAKGWRGCKTKTAPLWS